LDKDIREILKDEPEFKDKAAAGPEQKRELALLASRGGVYRQDERARLQDLEQRINREEESLIQLKEVLEKREKRLACTPSIYPVNGRITSRFGNRRSPFGRRIEFHDGLDIAAPYGTTIKATANGTVSFVGYRAGYGYCVDIIHGYGFKTSYCHNSKNLVKVGQRVTKGQAIAKVGNSGRSTGPHVHYMVYVNGTLKDPIDFCK
jgi:murein DD-endopeptidase MepM/ murein hydrolase activator NlpD